MYIQVSAEGNASQAVPIGGGADGGGCSETNIFGRNDIPNPPIFVSYL